MIGSISRELTISYSDKDLTKKGSAIMIRCILPWMLRAYDNSKREVLGIVTLKLSIRPMVQKVEFQVLNIASCFNMLLGRPWIHDIEAVPSSLYKKVWFPHEGAIVTIYGCWCLAGVQSPITATLVQCLEACRPGNSSVVEEGCISGVWLKYKSILRKLPRVSEVTTNHWFFSKTWLVTWLYLILLPILGYKKCHFS